MIVWATLHRMALDSNSRIYAYRGQLSAMERNLFKYIWFHSRKEQLVVLAVVLISLPFYFYSLTVPKLIVNQAIQGESFQDGVEKAPFMDINLGLPDFLGGYSFQLSSGLMLEQIPYLIALCLLFQFPCQCPCQSP